MSLQAGTGRADISPGTPMFLVGYPHVPRISAGVHDPLYASALCLRNGTETLILVAVDILFVDRASTRRCRQAIQSATGVPASHILIAATHTHSGPVTFEFLSMTADPVVPPPDPGYMAAFEAGICRAAVDAWRGTVPALLAFATARAEGVGGNRLSKEGVADPEVGLLYVVHAATRTPLGLVMAYAMHPTVLHEDSLLVSADFPAYARQHLTERWPGLTALYYTGPSGNQSPRHHVRGQTFAEAERAGRELGESVHRALVTIPTDAFVGDPVLRAVQGNVDLPVRTFPPVAEAVRRLAEARTRFEILEREHAGHGVVRTAECVVFGAEELVALARAQEEGRLEPWLRRALPAEVQVFRVGEHYCVGLPGELFVEYALDIKRRSPGRTLVVSMANGELQGYIVTPEADVAGGYEASCSFFTSESGTLLADAAVALAWGLQGDAEKKPKNA